MSMSLNIRNAINMPNGMPEAYQTLFVGVRFGVVFFLCFIAASL